MQVHFYIRFHTYFGQSLSISGNHPSLGSDDLSKALPMRYLNEQFWQVTVEVKDWADPIKYKYLLIGADGLVTEEWGNDRVVAPASRQGVSEIRLIDTWDWAGEYENAFYTQPFQQTLLLETKGTSRKIKWPDTYTHEFRVKAPLLKGDEILCLVGSGPGMGSWNTENLNLGKRENNWWVFRLDLSGQPFPVAYKYGVYDLEKGVFLQYEGGDNRLLYEGGEEDKIRIFHDGFVRLPNNTWKGTGVAIPVFSLKSESSFGVGEFSDIALLVDWAKVTSMKLIQLLPVNDTNATGTWVDSYPYAAISAFALHPLYLNLSKVAGKEYAGLLKNTKKQQKELNDLPDLDYEKVMDAKLKLLRKIYAQAGDRFEQDADYALYYEKNKHWLLPYAAFCYLRDLNGTVDFNLWKDHAVYDEVAIAEFVKPSQPHYPEIAFYYFLQYHLHLQLTEAVHYAHQQGIILKGDIPIGIYRYSCDAWVAPSLYNMEMQAGAPPDAFATKGQNWGFPTYNWRRMQEDGYEWWKSRFEQMSHYFDAFRIDHILGFFRIWSIPMHAVEGILGRFVPALPVRGEEFQARGITFDLGRYCLPYITEDVLWELFGSQKDHFHEFLQPGSTAGAYQLRPEFATQRQVEKHFADVIGNEETAYLRQGLYDLISNVICFIDEEDGDGFHFRFSVDQTISFRHLEQHVQDAIRDLYVDYFFRRQDDFWGRDAMEKLPALKRSTNMLVCGEDLGLVPGCVPVVMRELGILSLEVQRMPKQLGMEFESPASAPYLSVVTPSTHDMSTIRGWWEEDRARTQRFFNTILEQPGGAPFYCEPAINQMIVDQHLNSPAMWAIFLLQDILGSDGRLRRENPGAERINVPANPKHYWRYRMNVSLEQLQGEAAFNDNFKGSIHRAGRV
jgi:4-alpha-glucanotransferase